MTLQTPNTAILVIDVQDKLLKSIKIKDMILRNQKKSDLVQHTYQKIV